MTVNLSSIIFINHHHSSSITPVSHCRYQALTIILIKRVYKSPSAAINPHQSPPIPTNHHQSLPITINHHQPSPIPPVTTNPTNHQSPPITTNPQWLTVLLRGGDDGGREGSDAPVVEGLHHHLVARVLLETRQRGAAPVRGPDLGGRGGY